MIKVDLEIDADHRWSAALYQRLLAAGIPVLPDGRVEHGALSRVTHMPEGTTATWIWTPLNGGRP